MISVPLCTEIYPRTYFGSRRAMTGCVCCIPQSAAAVLLPPTHGRGSFAPDSGLEEPLDGALQREVGSDIEGASLPSRGSESPSNRTMMPSEM
jgi:hypothetical protein